MVNWSYSPNTNFHHRLVSSYLIYVVCVNFFFYRVLLLFSFIACQWHCPLPVISNKYNKRWTKHESKNIFSISSCYQFVIFLIKKNPHGQNQQSLTLKKNKMCKSQTEPKPYRPITGTKHERTIFSCFPSLVDTSQLQSTLIESAA